MVFSSLPSAVGRTCCPTQRFLKRFTVHVIGLLSICLSSYGQSGSGSVVTVSSGTFTLSPPSELGSSGRRDVSNRDGAEEGGDGDRRLFLAQCSDEECAWKLKSALESAGGSIQEFASDDAMLVFATPAGFKSAATTAGALVAEYRPDLKLSPAAAALLKAADTSQRRRLRALEQQDPLAMDPAKGRVIGGGLNHAGPNRRLSDADSAASAFSSLQTWRAHVATSKPDGSAAPAPSSGSGSGDAPGSSPSSTAGPGPSLATEATAATPDLFAALVRLVPSLPEQVLNNITRSWPPKLAAALGRRGAGDPCRPRMADDGLYGSTSSLLRVFLCAEDYKAGATWLISQSYVVWVEPLTVASVANAAAGWIMQTGGITAEQFANPTAGLRPYWRAQLQGQGIVVGMGDTGVDLSHCSFLDDQYRPGSLRALFTGSPPRLYLPYHRKVVQYVIPKDAGINAWFGDEFEGHGSHVAGSIAGAALNATGGIAYDVTTGSAPLARLSVLDFSKPGTSQALYPPLLYQDRALPYHHAVGARISSDSWAYVSGSAVTYLEISRQFDAFAWRNPDFLSVVAGGNNGQNAEMPTVTAPGTAKNLVAVGATLIQPKDAATSGYNRAFLFRYTDINGTLKQSAVFPSLLGSPANVWQTILQDTAVPLVAASPLDGCENMAVDVQGAVVLIDTFERRCAPDDGAIYADVGGAKAVLFIVEDDLFVPDSGRSQWFYIQTNVIFGLVTRAQGLKMLSVIGDPRNRDPHITLLTYPNINMDIDSVLSVSSYGPLPDGRIKPDIVAPGGPVPSACAGGSSVPRSDATRGSCSAESTVKQGTSMATALVSGHLALVRQYFRDGYYPTGAPGDTMSTKFQPSGMLLKAALIAGAKSLAGGFASNAGKLLGPSPDGYQGWGRVDLSGALPLPGFTPDAMRLQVADMGVIRQSQVFYIPGIRATGTGPITAALVWHDYPGSGLLTKQLINDLDFGFLINQNNSLNYRRTRPDNANNAERIELSGLQAGDRITFVVHGRTVRHQLLSGPDSQLPQRWAVLVAGHFVGTLKTPYNPYFMRPQQILDKVISLVLPNDTCAGVSGVALVPVSGIPCSQNSSIFSLTEEPAGNFSYAGGYLYTLRSTSSNSCVSVPTVSQGAVASLSACNPSDRRQKFAFYKNPYVNGSFYQIIPAQGLWTVNATRLCLRQQGSTNAITSRLSLAVCNDDDTLAMFLMQRSAAVPAAPPTPPPPTPSPPGPQSLVQPRWLPYPLAFQADWFPFVPRRNDYDYDYESPYDYEDADYSMAAAAASVDGSEASNRTTPVSDLDIVVAWQWQGADYWVGRGNRLNGSVGGAVYGGDNVNLGVQFENVFFQTGSIPPPTTYHVCVIWKAPKSPLMNVTLTVFRGYAVSRTSTVFNTTQPAPTWCNQSSAGYVGSYNAQSPAPPPSPPAPPQPPAPTYPYPLLIRVDWAVLSGMKGRGGIAVDLDLVVSWMDGSQKYLLHKSSPSAGGGLLGTDNMANLTFYEYAYWPANATLPQTTFRVCLRWTLGKHQPLVRARLSVFRGTLAATSSRVLDTTIPLTTGCDQSVTCDVSSPSYVDSYYLADGAISIPPEVPPCVAPPVPSDAIGLYFLTEWVPMNASAGGSVAVYDWDVVVSWTFGGKTSELARYSRFVGGGVHSGDNVQMSDKPNSEVVFWPTGVTGVMPDPATYHVCVRWHQHGALNVILTVFIGSNQVQFVTRSWNSSALYSKTCSPAAVGYVGSYEYSRTGTDGSGGTVALPVGLGAGGADPAAEISSSGGWR